MSVGAMTYLARRLAPLALVLLAGLPLSACSKQPAVKRPPLEGAAIGGPFTLVDKDNKPVTWDSFKGRWRIVYFGYTFCPDVCPLDMQETMRGFAEFAKREPAKAAKVQPIFITVDPQRDTPEIVGQWTSAFGPRLLGLTGTPQQIESAAKAFAIYYKKGSDTPGGYLMDHVRITYLFDPDGKPIAMLPSDQGRKAVEAELEKWVK
ncbi:SCO family protein [Novosphingobium resinovorum]|uniref:Electron transporter n=2 Tax=Novosphingobium resinovorum TaxID=158500 RepID=A0A1D8AB11_9SPHN|nr:SCO family protein [Novosphingobium resinovorum]AOR79300.1 electron transporter [Novosphingobium resinovorum]